VSGSQQRGTIISTSRHVRQGMHAKTLRPFHLTVLALVAFCRCCFNGRDVYSLYPLFSCQNCVFALGVSVGMMVPNLSVEIMEQGPPACLYTSK